MRMKAGRHAECTHTHAPYAHIRTALCEQLSTWNELDALSSAVYNMQHIYSQCTEAHEGKLPLEQRSRCQNEIEIEKKEMPG